MRSRKRVSALVALAAGIVAALATTPSAFGWTVDMTAQTSLKRTYQWTIAKTASVPTVTLKAGETATVEYSVTVTNTGSTDSNWAVGGNVTFSSDPSITIGSIQAFATPPGMFGPEIAGTIGCMPALPASLAGGLSCAYNIALPNADPGDAHAKATVAVPPGFRHVSAPFDFSNPTVNQVDECVNVTDSMAGALGTVCVGDSPKTFTYTKTIGPYSEEECGDHTVDNTARFVTNDTGATGSAGASVNVTVVCEPPSGCTRTIGYWKTHAGFGPQADVVTPLLPVRLGTAGGAKSVNVTTAAQAVALLKKGDSSNGIEKLYAQLLGAKLNIASGASSSSVASIIAAADAFLATHNASDWESLSSAQKAQVLSWMTTLDNYNNGLVGPEHCD